MTKSVALYARVSSERQVQQATIDSQVAALRARATQDGFMVLPSDEYVDNGHSGSSLRRPALERLRDRVAQGAVDTLYVHSPDRLARRHAHQVLLLEELASRGVRVTMLEGRNGDSAEDQLLVQVQGVIAEYERAKIMERSRRGKLHKARIGSVNVLSNAPYGYRYIKKCDGAPAHYQVVLHEAQVVRRIFDAVVREQKTLRGIAQMLNEEGVPPRGEPTRRAQPIWRAGAIHDVLRNPSYMGQAAFGKTERVERTGSLRPVIGRATVPKTAKSGVRERTSDEWIRIPVPAIVSQEVFAAVEAQLERSSVFATRNRKSGRYLLAGLTVCVRCGYGYYGRCQWSGGRERKRLAYYYCGASSSSPGSELMAIRGCHNRGVRGDLLEAEIWRSVCALLENPGRVMQEWSRRADTTRAGIEHDAQREAALQLVRSHERALQRLVDAYEAGALDLADLTTRSDRVRARIAQAHDELATLEKVLAERRELQLVIARVEDFAQRVRKGLEALSWEERRTIVRTLIARIEIADDDVTIVYRVPTSSPTGSPTTAPTGSSNARPRAAPTVSSSAPTAPTVPAASGIVDCVQGVSTPWKRAV
jgi:site-specific DNA recombinase